MLKTINQRVSIILLLLAIGYLYLSYQLPSFAYTNVDADVLPKALGWLLAVLSIALFFSKDSETEEQKARRDIPRKDLGMIAIVFLLILGYIFLFEFLGFILVTLLFIFFSSLILGYKNYITNGIVSVLFPVILYFAFTEFLQINLPQGILPF
ncbi:tripartite tricarboxylate transporter TctB family protein [Salinicoccus kekensis]|uniref:Putative tricarboxylic transport membrane protein n=1 Tax=Salinicoccus kekensis TaxID=714307 RepID=A0A285UFI1_9STAP|nr:tripartite tricarboxylate transporter TctB family protein [Salinicoccus kekensis]SOC40694.1 putative tricarboxylic transport membrane protein [Salinicoccus kekensis]